MAFRQYPDSIAAVVSTGSPYTIDLGTADPDANQQLEFFGLQIFKRGMQPTVRMRINAYVSDVLQGVSQDVVVHTIENLYPATDTFYGWVRFEFSPRYNFNTVTPTRFELELENYAYSPDDSVFIAAVLDWPVTMSYNSNPGSVNTATMAIELYGAI